MLEMSAFGSLTESLPLGGQEELEEGGRTQVSATGPGLLPGR